METFNPLTMIFNCLAPWLFSKNYKEVFVANVGVCIVIGIIQCFVLFVVVHMAGFALKNAEWEGAMLALSGLLIAGDIFMVVHAVEEVGLS